VRGHKRSGVAFVVVIACGACTSILGDFSSSGTSTTDGGSNPPEATVGVTEGGVVDGTTTGQETSAPGPDSPIASEDDGGEDSAPSFAPDASCEGGPCVTAISCNSYHACAIMADQSVTCWGDNNWGQSIWNGPTPSVTTPTTVTFADGGVLGPVKLLRVGDRHTCVVLVDGSVWCWGDDTVGQIGVAHLFAPDASQMFPVPPTEVYGPGSVSALVAGLYHTCVFLTSDSGLSPVYCWGSNNYGEVSPADAAVVPTPVQISIPQFERIALGAYVTCVTKSATEAECIGNNQFGELGRGIPADAGVGPNGPGTDNLAHPVAAPVAPLPGGAQYQDLSHAAGSVSGGTLVGGGVALCGNNGSGQLGPQVTADGGYPVPTIVDIADVTVLTMAQNSTCALRSGGSVYCWGSTASGQNGNTTTTTLTQPNPAAVTGITSAVGLSAGFAYICALNANGTVACWGDNTYAQLGFSTGTATFSAVPGLVQF
jgi:alpha-tubulin suppressor-like RCC1 family protein